MEEFYLWILKIHHIEVRVRTQVHLFGMNVEDIPNLVGLHSEILSCVDDVELY